MNRFYDHSSQPWYLSPEYRRSDVPTDGFEQYTENIWSVIRDNKDLDLPQQKQILATYRCESISSAVFKNFKEKYNELKEQVFKDKKSFVDNLGKEIDSIVSSALDQYTKETNHYIEEIRKEKYSILRSKIENEIELIETEQLNNLNSNIMAEYDTNLTKYFIQSSMEIRQIFKSRGKILNKKYGIEEGIELEPIVENQEIQIPTIYVGKALNELEKNTLDSWKEKTKASLSKVIEKKIDEKERNEMLNSFATHALNIKKQLAAIYVKQFSVYIFLV